MSRQSDGIYGKYGVYGSLAYDFRPEGNEGSGDYCRTKSPSLPTNRRIAPGSSPAFGVACVLCAVLLAAGLMARSSLVVISDETAQLQTEIEELLDEQTRLKIRHEKAFPLAETEEYATEVLGMKKPASGQIIYIDIVPMDEEAGNNVTGEKGNIFSFLREYFPG